MGNLNICTFNKNSNGLTSRSFEIPASAYCHSLAKIKEMKSYKIIQGKLTKTISELPKIGINEILVKVNAISLNYRDLLVTEGTEQWKPAENRVPCSDAAGEVIAVGNAISKFAVGDQVTSLILPNWEYGKLSQEKLTDSLGGSGRDGVLSEYIVLPENALCKFPDYLSYEEACTLPVAALTAWNAVVEQSTLKLGSTILIIGTGGVSLFSLQLSKLAGYRIIITSSSDEKLSKAKELGAHHTINYKTHENWTEEVLKITNYQGVDQVVDVVGGEHISQSLKCVKSEGVVSMVGVIAGTSGIVDTGTIMMKAARIQGVETGSTEMYKEMLTAFELHKIKPVINRIFSFDNTLDAFSYLKNGKHLGKVCISLK